MHPFVSAALGGLLIGLGAAVLLLAEGRIAGVSGITFRFFAPGRTDRLWRAAFLAGIVGVGLLVPGTFSSLPARPFFLVLGAGLLVGAGATWANGCTSGHGVCGIGRGSVRSIVATVTFMTTAALTVLATRHL